MTDIERMQVRIEELETAMAHQDRTVDDLNRMVVEQWKHIEDLTRRVRGLSEQIEEFESRGGAARPVDPPPHY